MTEEELNYLFVERVGIGMIEGGLNEYQAKQQARKEMIFTLKESGMKLHKAVFEVYKIESEYKATQNRY